jgi:hypothetical protein
LTKQALLCIDDQAISLKQLQNLSQVAAVLLY